MELKFSGSIQDLPASDRLELLVASVTDCAIYLLDRDGVIRTWNTGAERIKGYRAAEIIGQHFSLFFTPEDKAADLPGQILARAGRNGRAEQEGWRIRKDGGRFWASSVVQPVRDGPRPRHRLCQNHPRHDRAAASATGALRERAQVSSAGQGGDVPIGRLRQAFFQVACRRGGVRGIVSWNDESRNGDAH